MNIKFEDAEQSLTQDEISTFEDNYKIKLPENYKTLILKYNGGLVEGVDYIDTLLSIKYGPVTVNDTIEIHQILEDNIPKGYFPFADDWGGNPITLCLIEGSDYGKVVKFYFDTDDEPKIIAESLESLFKVSDINHI